MQVETKNASLDTMSVTIQALHVSGKQMTLAVFRQLPKAMAIEKNGTLAKLEFWGLVRYSIKDESDLWAVASAGGILYRCDAQPYFPSIAECERDETAAVAEFEKYRQWEPAKIAWDNYRFTPFEQRGERPNIAIPEYCGHFRIGHEQDYLDAVSRSVVRSTLARQWARSVSTLAALPQLFIAV